MALTPVQIAQFIDDGFVRLDDAFPREVADAGRAILWRDTGCAPDDPSTWTAPVIRLGGHHDLPFRDAASTPRLHAALDLLIGAGAWGARLSQPNATSSSARRQHDRSRAGNQ